jgi:serine protease inhibitor ecotin
MINTLFILDITKMKNVPSGKTELVKYISVLPLVVYAPRDIEIKYKIWKQDPRELDAKSF